METAQAEELALLLHIYIYFCIKYLFCSFFKKINTLLLRFRSKNTQGQLVPQLTCEKQEGKTGEGKCLWHPC